MTQREATLAVLRAAGERGVTSLEFVKTGCGLRYGARVQELRAEGYEIDVARIGSDPPIYRYTLTASPERPAVKPFTRHGETTADGSVPASADRSEDADGTLFQLPEEQPTTTRSAITGKPWERAA